MVGGGGGGGGSGASGERPPAGVDCGLWMPFSQGRQGTDSMLPSELIANKPAEQSSVADTGIGFRQRLLQQRRRQPPAQQVRAGGYSMQLSSSTAAGNEHAVAVHCSSLPAGKCS